MTHPRKSLRASLLSVLTGLPATGSHVYQYKRYPLDPSVLPAIRFYITGDDANEKAISQKTAPLDRNVRVTVEVVVKQADAAEAAVDDICESVEAAIDAASLPIGRYVGTEIDTEQIADQQVVVGRMSYEFQV
jgi:hypothetical protein